MKTIPVTRRQFVKTSYAAAGAALLAPVVFPSAGPRAAAVPKPALLGGKPAVEGPFPSWPMIEKLDEEKFMDALRRKAWCRLYDNITTTFENAWAERLGAKYCVATVNGTNSLYAALNAVDVGPGDEVLLPPYTFVATLNAILQQYALPVFVDSDIQTFQMDPRSMEAKITPNTRCVMPVHLGGGVADMDAILQNAQKHNLTVIEDACQSHLSEWKGKCVGGLGDVGCFSFQSTKVLPCGEGGACVTQKEEIYNQLHAFHNNGRDRVTGTRQGYIHQGTNLRMTEYQSALLLAQLTRLDEQCRHREANALYLGELLQEIPGVRPAGMYAGQTRNSHYLYMMHYDKSQFDGLSRARFLEALDKEGVGCYGGYKPLNKEPFLKTLLNSRWYQKLFPPERLKQYWETNECPVNDRLCEEGIFMGHECLMGTRAQIEQIAMAIRRIKAHAKELKA
ncbi:MAG: DegT/DnrJ/EryC1/StrS family aminotransferase [bacterium]